MNWMVKILVFWQSVGKSKSHLLTFAESGVSTAILNYFHDGIKYGVLHFHIQWKWSVSSTASQIRDSIYWCLLYRLFFEITWVFCGFLSWRGNLHSFNIFLFIYFLNFLLFQMLNSFVSQSINVHKENRKWSQVMNIYINFTILFFLLQTAD